MKKLFLATGIATVLLAAPVAAQDSGKGGSDSGINRGADSGVKQGLDSGVKSGRDSNTVRTTSRPH